MKRKYLVVLLVVSLLFMNSCGNYEKYKKCVESGEEEVVCRAKFPGTVDRLKGTGGEVESLDSPTDGEIEEEINYIKLLGEISHCPSYVGEENINCGCSWTRKEIFQDLEENEVRAECINFFYRPYWTVCMNIFENYEQISSDFSMDFDSMDEEEIKDLLDDDIEDQILDSVIIQGWIQDNKAQNILASCELQDDGTWDWNVYRSADKSGPHPCQIQQGFSQTLPILDKVECITEGVQHPWCRYESDDRCQNQGDFICNEIADSNRENMQIFLDSARPPINEQKHLFGTCSATLVSTEQSVGINRDHLTFSPLDLSEIETDNKCPSSLYPGEDRYCFDPGEFICSINSISGGRIKICEADYNTGNIWKDVTSSIGCENYCEMLLDQENIVYMNSPIEKNPDVEHNSFYNYKSGLEDYGNDIDKETWLSIEEFFLPFGLPDRDSDGLPDDFEEKYGFPENSPTKPYSGGGGGSKGPTIDGDFYTNLNEYVMGLNPLSPDPNNLIFMTHSREPVECPVSVAFEDTLVQEICCTEEIQGNEYLFKLGENICKYSTAGDSDAYHLYECTDNGWIRKSIICNKINDEGGDLTLPYEYFPLCNYFIPTREDHLTSCTSSSRPTATPGGGYA